MNYVSSIGVLPDVLDITSSAVGLNVSGGRAGNTSDFIGGQILPAAGVVNDAYNAAGGLLGIPVRAIQGKPIKPGATAHDLVKLVPGANLPYLQAAMNQLD